MATLKEEAKAYVPEQAKNIADLKAILEKKPTLKTFSVSKKGQGLNTQYTVIPLD